MDVIQIAILGVAGALLAVQFKSGKTEYGIYISLALSLFIFFAVVSRLKILVDLLAQIGDYIQMDAAYTGTLLKMLGITYVAEFSSAICKDAGYQTIAVQIEIFAKLAILVLSMPVLMALLSAIRDFCSRRHRRQLPLPGKECANGPLGTHRVWQQSRSWRPHRRGELAWRGLATFCG